MEVMRVDRASVYIYLVDPGRWASFLVPDEDGTSSTAKVP
jgi:hypothetical protein